MPKVYNFPIAHDVGLDHFMDQAQYIYRDQQYSYKVQLHLGFILHNTRTGRYRYFKPSRDEKQGVLKKPFVVSKGSNITFLRTLLRQYLDPIDFMRRARENSEWQSKLLCNARWVVTPMTFALGCLKNQELPQYLKDSHCIRTLEKRDQNGRPYTDNYCAFRCLSLSRGADPKALETPTKMYLEQWKGYQKANNLPRSKHFSGIQTEDLPHFESCFKISVNVFSLKEDGTCTMVYKSLCRFSDVMNLNLYGNHLQYISNMNGFAKKFQCIMCEKLFDHKSHCDKHIKTCENKTKFRYPGGYYQAAKSVFTELSEFGIHVPEQLQYFPWFETWDLESILTKLHSDTEGAKLRYTRRHDPISVSICSNVPEYTDPHCEVEKELDRLLEGMVNYMTKIQEHMCDLSAKRWGTAIKDLDELLQKWGGEDDTLPDRSHLQESVDEEVNFNVHPHDLDGYESEDEAGEEDGEGKEKLTWQQRVKRRMVTLLTNLKAKFTTYVTQIPILAYNCSRYDLNVLKKKLAKYLELHKSESSFTVKRANSYLCMTNEKFRFLDMSQYVAPNTSYDGLLKAFHIKQTKSFLPYEWLDHVSKLDYPGLPETGQCEDARDDPWYSSLKECNVLEADLVKYKQKIVEGLSEIQALKALGLKEKPKTAQETLASLNKIFQDRGMKTFKDWLVYYNNLDTKPFVEAATKLQQFYRDRNIDVFKTTISVPGCSRQLLFNTAKQAGAHFAVFGKEAKDVYNTVKSNLVGGPSIVFHRHHKVGETYIRGNRNKVCKSIQGWDANSLYLACINEKMPTGPFIHRQAETGFKPIYQEKYTQMYHWMDWLNESQKCNISHKLNSSREFRIGPYLVDGIDGNIGHDANRLNNINNKPTIYEYDGCYWHGHDCHLTKNVKLKDWEKVRKRREERTKDRQKFLKSQGYNICVKKECEFLAEVKQNTELKAFIANRKSKFTQRHKYTVSEDQILTGVEDGTLFGMVEVDISIPETWKPGKEKHLPPKEYFSEMAPIFSTCDVPFTAFGEHMKEHLLKQGMGSGSRRLLVGGLRAKKILLATPLLKYYLELGLEVTRIYQTLEFKPQACFTDFVQQVTDGRRQGDLDPNSDILASTYKLIGNAAYGSLIMQKERHQNIKYVFGQENLSKHVNEPQFRSVCNLDDDMYELEMAKKSISLNLPIQLGFFILQLAKLRMLEFYYEFMDKFVDRSDFHYIEMDTDSAYLALATTTLREAIKPGMLAEYEAALSKWCVDDNGDEIVDIKANRTHWFARQCCTKHTKRDKRTVGLFKLEFEGTEMTALCSKTYAVTDGQQTKVSSKGIDKRRLSSPMSAYNDVLDTQMPGSGENVGFRVRDGQVFSYSQERTGLSYFYCKREIQNDGISTKPLNIVLTPVHDGDCLSNLYPCDLSYTHDDGSLLTFNSGQQMLEWLKAVKYESDEKLVKAILASKDPIKAAMLGESVKCGENWEACFKNYYQKLICELKFKSCPEVRKTVLSDLPSCNFSEFSKHWHALYSSENVDCLSNSFQCKVFFHDKTFHYGQHMLEWLKATSHGQFDIASQILNAESPSEVARLGESYKTLDSYTLLNKDYHQKLMCKSKYESCEQVRETVMKDQMAVKNSEFCNYWKVLSKGFSCL